ncbi:putative DNA 3'-phosphatase Tpp1 [Xylona heveae TC161]|uniref:Putative DNA 3'-phosphatase Tpp1 n=1 Tax=Xylona heveae (strain CBS 132557 / TC161) TaxID=1328760 RepID=A0A165J5R8_XYLHT|nr:putative DNA 3'-phosphatase Tpp1 [Xylona heveae TC161]KZF25768.1 putative DNA 3'-phosphatase Tpp1 [Xylona heveae TC161]
MADSKNIKRRLSTGGSVSPPPLKRKVQSSTTKGALAQFFTPASKKEPEKASWTKLRDSLLIGRYAPETEDKTNNPNKRPSRIAGFDLDWTLIKSKSGNRHPRDGKDWRWWHPNVPGCLKDLHAQGFRIVIFSNQGGITLKSKAKTPKSDRKRLNDFKERGCSIFNQLQIPLVLYAATEKDHFRKPRAGMWDEMLEEFDLRFSGSINFNESFFVGDAGGRAAAKATVKDHSCSDRDFAANVGVKFYTPEEFFLKEKPRPFTREFDPVTFLSIEGSRALEVFSRKSPLEIVLFCGSPGAGKSTFFWRQLGPLGYVRVNQDILKTREKCLQRAAQLLGEKQSVVIDNTNADVETRAHWIKLAKAKNVPIRCVYFTASARLCEHNDIVRSLNGELMNPEKRTLLPKVAFTGFTSRFREPTLEEGFEDIIKVDFQFEGNEQQRAIWARYWV